MTIDLQDKNDYPDFDYGERFAFYIWPMALWQA